MCAKYLNDGTIHSTGHSGTNILRASLVNMGLIDIDQDLDIVAGVNIWLFAKPSRSYSPGLRLYTALKMSGWRIARFSAP